MNPIGELGEYHTLVLDCPIYKKRDKHPQIGNCLGEFKGISCDQELKSAIENEVPK